MRILTLWQPWASLVALGLKQYETRSWGTNYQGKLLIHAAKKLLDDEAIETTWKVQELTGQLLNPVDFKYPLGSIVAIASLTNCRMMVEDLKFPCNTAIHRENRYSIASQTELEKAVGNWKPGRYAWRLEDINALPEPIPFKGGQGLRLVRDEVVMQKIVEAFL